MSFPRKKGGTCVPPFFVGAAKSGFASAFGDGGDVSHAVWLVEFEADGGAFFLGFGDEFFTGDGGAAAGVVDVILFTFFGFEGVAVSGLGELADFFDGGGDLGGWGGVGASRGQNENGAGQMLHKILPGRYSDVEMNVMVMICEMGLFANANFKRFKFAGGEGFGFEQIDPFAVDDGGGFGDGDDEIIGAGFFACEDGICIAVGGGLAELLDFEGAGGEFFAGFIEEVDGNLEVFGVFGAAVEGEDGGALSLAGPNGVGVPEFDGVRGQGQTGGEDGEGCRCVFHESFPLNARLIASVQ